jgi:hypothetical protein
VLTRRCHRPDRHGDHHHRPPSSLKRSPVPRRPGGLRTCSDNFFRLVSKSRPDRHGDHHHPPPSSFHRSPVPSRPAGEEIDSKRSPAVVLGASTRENSFGPVEML